MKSITKRIIHNIGKVPIFRSVSAFIFKGAHKKYTSAMLKPIEDAYRNYGLEAISEFDKCMRENNHPYTLAFGSILGAVREQGFIKHDLDIDTFMWIENFTPDLIKDLKKAGFTWSSHYSVSNDKYGREDTFSYKGVNIDIFYLYPKINNYPYCCDFVHEKGMKKHERLPRRIELPVSKERKLVPFETLELYVPENAEELCEFRYGPNYMIPDPSWDWVNDKSSVVEWHDKISETKHIVNPVYN